MDGIVPPLRATELPPFAAVTVPPQPVPFAGVALIKPAGYVSVNAAPVMATPFVFVRLNVSVDVPTVVIVVGVNDLENDGAVRFDTVSAAEPVFVFAPLFAVVTPLGLIVFVYVFVAADVTVTVTLHVLLAGIVPPASATNVPPSPAVTVPPQPDPFAGVALIKPPG